MDRRSTLATLIGKPLPAGKNSPRPTPAVPPANGLEPYSGAWGFEQAAHLLRRTTFGPTIAQIKTAIADGLQGTLTKLFTEPAPPPKPLNLDYASDTFVPIGQTWIDAPYNNADANIAGYRNRSLRSWIYDNILNEKTSIKEQLILFWHNHFATSDVDDPVFLYYHLDLLRKYAWGDFKELVKAMTIDPTMLRFLNGNLNTRTAPNENYARELLELFTIGKGAQAGPGDYTNYTEQDVKELARALTGWRDNGYRTTTTTQKVGSIFRPTLHDTTSKQLSQRFGNAIITNQNELEYKTVVDIIFQQAEVARFICRKLYRWFVYYDITPEVESQVIQPMAQLLIDNTYQIKPALQALLKSAHFFNVLNIGPMIKNPIVFSLGAIKQSDISILPANQTGRYNVLNGIFRLVTNQQMTYLDPPDVAGWKAFYQAPSFYRIWINATTLNARMGYTNRLATDGHLLSGFRVKIDVLTLVKTLDNPSDPNDLIKELVRLYLPQPLTGQQLEDLKEILLPGLPDYEWTVEYKLHLANPNDTGLRTAVEAKLRNLFKALLSMAEFYLS